MKFNFLINKSTDVLIVDEGYSGLKIDHKKFYLLKNEIYLIYLFKSLFDSIKKINFSINLIKMNYFKNLIESLNPKIVIGHDMNDRIFKIKKNFPYIKTIVYQFGYLFKEQDEKIYGEILKNKKSNYYLVFNNNSKKFVNKFVKTKVIVAGSVKNNEKIIEKKNKKYDFYFISQYRPLSRNVKDNYYLLYERNNMKKIISKVIKYCDENNKSLVIALSSNRNDKLRYSFIKEEINFYRSISSKILFFPKKKSLEIASFCKVAICYSSNLGAEILAQGNKVIFFGISKYAKFLFKKKNTMCNIESINQKLINKKFNNILNISDSNWKKYCKKIQLIRYDKKNKLLNDLLLKLLNTVK